MNTFLTVGLSVLGTLTTMTGAVAVASKVPAVKDKITISYEDKVVVGTDNQNNTKYEEIIEQLRTENAEKESMITELNSSIQINNERIAELEQSEEDKSEEIDRLQSENQAKTSQIEILNETVASNQSTINELQNKVDSYETKLEDYVFVKYVVDGVETEQIQTKNSVVDFTEPSKEGFVFDGWSLSLDGELISDDYLITEDMTLYATFSEKPREAGLYSADGAMSHSWQQLISSGYITVSNNVITKANLSSVSGDLVISKDITSTNNLTSSFEGNSTITSISFEEGSKCTSFGATQFTNMTALKTFICPDSLTVPTSEYYFLMDCPALETLVLSENLSNINSFALIGYMMETAPNNINIVVKNTTPPVCGEDYGACQLTTMCNEVTVYIPVEAVEIYSNHALMNNVDATIIGYDDFETLKQTLGI